MPNLLLSSIKTTVGGLTSIKDVDKHLRRTLSQLINNINDTYYAVPVLAEVKKVYATEEDLENDDDGVPKYEYLGGIEFKEVTKKSGTSKGIPAKSLNSNLTQIPVEGEYVLIQRFFGEYYYTPQVNIFNNPNNSSYQGFSTRFKSKATHRDSSKTIETDNTGIAENKSAAQVRTLGDKFLSNFNLRQIIPEEGNVTLNGRFGNSIRLGSNIKNGTPNIRIRAGQDTQYDDVNILAKENINKDASSIYLSTNEPVSIFNPSFPNKRVEGKSIVLNSDKLFFNGKNGDVNIRASKDVIIEGESVIINAKKGQTIKMGDPRAPMLPTVNGQKLFELFTGLMKLLSAVPKISNPATAVQAGKDILKELPKVTKQVKNKEFLNMQVMTADPGFKVPNIPPKKPLPDTDVSLAKKKTGVKIKKKPSLGDLKQ